MRRLIFLSFLLGACSSADSNELDVIDAGVDVPEADVSIDPVEVGPSYVVSLQSEKLAVGATQVVAVHLDGRPFDGPIEWTITGNAIEVSPKHFQAQAVGPVQLSAIVAGEQIHASFEVVSPRWKAVSAGPRTTCVLDALDEAYCMGHLGNEASSNLVKVPGGHKFQEISAGSSFACGISSGDVYCWGENTSGQLGAGADIHWAAEPIPILVDEEVIEISTGLYFACASSADTSWCWGESGYYQTGRYNDQPRPVELREHVRGISAGHYHACGIQADGVSVCWGANVTYQIEAINRNSFDFPYPVSQANEFETIHAGRFHTCGRAADGVVTCWGDYESTPPGFFNHQEVGRKFKHLSLNGAITCGIDQGNALECLGPNSLGTLGVGDTSPREVWSQVSGRWWKFDGSNYGGCALNLAGELFCWGTNYSGAFGQNLQPVLVTPTELPGISVDKIIFAEGLICWLDAGLVACRGESTEALLGDSRLAPSVHSTPLLPAGTYTNIYAAGKTACALSDEGDLYCWGIMSGFDYNDVGHPVKVVLPGPAKDVYLGAERYHVVALADGTFRDWDSVNYFPTMTAGLWVNDAAQQPLDVVDYQHQKYTTVALTQGKQIYCGGRLCDADASWGNPDLGVSNIKSIHLINELLCALDDSGSLWCVREINGVAKWTVQDWPVSISAASHDADVICVLDVQGVACMGSNSGQAQLMSPNIQSAPLHRIPGTEGATAIKVGFKNVCAKMAGKWMCWGDNRAGQLTKTEVIFPSPTAVN